MLTKRKHFNEGLILAQSLSQSLLASISVRKKSMAAPFASRLCSSSVGPIRSMCTLPNRTSLPFRNSPLSLGNVAHARFFRSPLRATPFMIPIICLIERCDLSVIGDQSAQCMNASHSWITARRASRSCVVSLRCLLLRRIVIFSDSAHDRSSLQRFPPHNASALHSRKLRVNRESNARFESKTY
jgi:hypothetical protein